jgi:putative ABC transport system ATP-binding protein
LLNQHQIGERESPPLAGQNPDRQNGQPLIRLRDVVKTYPAPAGDFTALHGITADVRRGEFLAIIGKSGAGKSTLVNMITGVDKLTAGQVWVDDTSVHTLSESRRALWRGRNIGVVYQTFELLPTLSLLDNVMLPMDFCALYQPQESRERAKALLREVGLIDHIEKPPTRISGGQQQRVAIARALINDPPIIVADEPTGNLDSVTAEEIFRLFEALVAQGKTIVIVTHDESLAPRVTRVLRIADGEIVDEA